MNDNPKVNTTMFMKYLLPIVLVFTSNFCFGQESYQSKYLKALNTNDTTTIEQFLKNTEEYNKYMESSFPENLLSIAYKNGCLKYFDIIAKAHPELLTMEIPVPSGGHDPQPPTIFLAITDNDIGATKKLIELGFPLNGVWNGVVRYPYNLLSLAKTKDLKEYLLQKGVAETIEINNWKLDSIDDSINLRDAPNKSGKIIGKISKGEKGIILKVFIYSSVIDGQNGYWIYVKFAEKEGWTFSAYYHIPKFDGM
jgi:hypothetical protein